MSGKYVVMFDAVGNQPKGARVTIDDLYHEQLPARDQHWQRLIALDAIRPESDEEAKALPVAYARSAAAPIIPAGRDRNFGLAVVAPAASLPPTVDRYMPLPEQAKELAKEEHQPAVQGEGELRPVAERPSRSSR